MSKSWSWRSSLNFWFDPSAWIQIKDMGVVEIDISLFLSSVIVTTKVQNGRTNQSCWVSTSCTWWNSLNLRKCPKPRSFLVYRKKLNSQIFKFMKNIFVTYLKVDLWKGEPFFGPAVTIHDLDHWRHLVNSTNFAAVTVTIAQHITAGSTFVIRIPVLPFAADFLEFQLVVTLFLPSKPKFKL